MPCCGGTEMMPFLWAFPIVMANYAATTQCRSQKRKSNPERSRLLEKLNAQVLDEVRLPSHQDEDEIGTKQYVEVDEEGVIML
jgi:hypothetical protein